MTTPDEYEARARELDFDQPHERAYPIVARALRAEAARALTEAASEVARSDAPWGHDLSWIAKWLRARADAIEGGE